MNPCQRILVIEDNDDHAEIVTRLLKSVSEMAVDRVTNLTRGMQVLERKAHKFDGVLLDLTLPDSSHDSMLNFIERFGGILPIIVLTALDDDDLAHRLLKAGAQDYLTKTALTSNSIFKSISYAIERKKLQNQLKSKSDELVRKNIFLEKLVVERTERLSKSEQKYRSLVNLSPISVIICDEDGSVKFTNREFQKVFGYKKENKLDNLFALFDRNDDEGVKSVQCLFKNGFTQTARRNADLRKINGARVIGQITITQVPMGGKRLNEKRQFLLLIDDMTETLKREKIKQQKIVAERANKAKSEFLTHVSHEIRTPLTAITGYVDLLISHHENDTLEKQSTENYFKSLKRNSQHLLLLVNDLLDLGKIESGQLDVNPVKFSLFDEVAAVVDMVKPLISQSPVAIEVSYEGFIPKHIVLDVQKFRQILLNLINNSIKYTDLGSIKVVIGVTVNEESGYGHLYVEVKDTGKGIMPELVEQLFLPFSRGKDADVLRKDGVGVGLALSKKLAVAMGGNLTLKETEPGQGSTFEISLPLGSMNQAIFYRPSQGIVGEKSMTANVHHFSPSTVLAGKRILVVEDVDDIQILIRSILNKQGVEVVLCDNGQQALDILETQSFDLILMDIQMPVKDGITTVKELRGNGYAGRVMALTAHAFKEEHDRCLQAGFDGFITKPFTEDCVISKVRDQIQSSSQADNLFRKDVVSDSPRSDLDAEAVEIFYTNLARNIDSLKKSLSTNDRDSMAKVAHKIKGSAGCYSFNYVSELARDLESLVKMEGQEPQIEDFINKLDDEKNKIQVEIGKSVSHAP